MDKAGTVRAIPSGCAHKVRYSKRKLALQAAANATRRRGVRLHAYHCHDCHCWHLTGWTPEQHKAHRANK